MTNATLRIATDAELEATLERIRHFQAQVVRLRQMETDPEAYRLASSGFLTEIDRMQAAVREFLSSPADKLAATS